MDPKLQRLTARGRLTRVLPRREALSRHSTAGGWKRRKGGLHPWRRGRIRPSTCRDYAAEE